MGMSEDGVRLRLNYSRERPEGVHPLRWGAMLRQLGYVACPGCGVALEEVEGAKVYHLPCLKKELEKAWNNN